MSDSWTIKQIKDHESAAQKLSLIKDEVADFISKNSQNVFERDIVLYVKKAYKRHGLINDDKKEFAICAFGTNTKEVHYFASTKSQKLKATNLILLDIWARLDRENAPYADATFMFYYIERKSEKSKANDKKLEEYNKVWKVLVKSRDSAVQYIKKEIKKAQMPRGLDIDRTSHDIIGEAGLAKGIKHTVGHSLGYKSPHGDLPGINWREYSPLQKNIGYTIEPGIYLENFGMRTEIDFYINNKNEMIITTPVQKVIEIIK